MRLGSATSNGRAACKVFTSSRVFSGLSSISTSRITNRFALNMAHRGEVAQQSHSRNVAQDYFCDINRRFLNHYGSGVGSVTLVAAACAVRSTGVQHDQADIAAEAADGRRHDYPQHVAEYAESLHLRRGKL